MTISFNEVPNNQRVPGVFIEVDNSRALKELYQNNHKALIIGQKIIGSGTVSSNTLTQITGDDLADGYYGTGSQIARMINKFKANNENTELWAVALSDAAGVAASGALTFSVNASVSTGGATFAYNINGTVIKTTLASGQSNVNIIAAIVADVNDSAYSATLGMYASATAGSNVLNLVAHNLGTTGNYLYFDMSAYPAAYTNDTSNSPTKADMAGGATDPSIAVVWEIIQNKQFQHIIQPYIDATNLTSLEDELTDRWTATEGIPGWAYGAVRGTSSSCVTLGTSRNNQYNTIIGAYESPTDPAEWAAAYGAIGAFNLNQDPARPLHTLKLKGIAAPADPSNRFTKTEQRGLLYGGIATWMLDTSEAVLLQRCITTYKANALGNPDYSYLDIQTPATLAEINYQIEAHLSNRFIVPRFKLADDGFPAKPGMNVATPSSIRQEIIALFLRLQNDVGLIENIDDFIKNLVVERNASDPNRVDALLPPDLINQVRIIAGKLQFIL